MCQPKKWWWGLLPLAILFGLMNAMTAGPVEGDLARRSADVFKASGLPWASATLSGRDAVIKGEAPGPESKLLAIDAAERAWGVRKVADQITVAPEIKPYAASATRDGNRITLTGHVPNDATRAALVKDAKAAFAGAEVVDQLKDGRGAPALFGPVMSFGLGQLAKLAKGTASLSDSAFSIVGQALDFPALDAVTAAVKALPGGASLAKAEISAPRVSPFTFTATKSADTLALTGYIPNESVRAPLIEAAKAVGGRITDALRVADGLPAGLDFGKVTGFMFEQLGKLKSGVASLSNDSLTVTGEAPSATVKSGIGSLLSAALPAGLKLAKQDITVPAPPPPPPAPAPVAQAPAIPPPPAPPVAAAPPPPPPPPPVSPYVWTADRDNGVVMLAGSIPSEAVRGPIIETVRQAFPRDRLVDSLKVGRGEPDGFYNSVVSSLRQLATLDRGSINITDKVVKIVGETFDAALPDKIKAALSGVGLPPGFSALPSITVKMPPPPLATPTVTANPPVPQTATPPVSILPPDLPSVVAVIPPAPAAPPAPPAAPAAPAIPPAPLSPPTVTANPPVPQTATPPAFLTPAAPAAPSPAAQCQMKLMAVLDNEQLHFNTASATIRSGSERILKELAAAAAVCPDLKVEVQGHTDSEGADEYNLDLSNRRAAAVVEALEDLGVAKGRLTAKGYGKTRPIAPNDTPANRAKNRRIEFVVSQ